MTKDGYYSSGEFAKLAHVTLRTIRYYDKQNILKPSFVKPSGARFYTDKDLAKLQQILLLKYLGFSLEDIRELTIDETDLHFLQETLQIQLGLVRDKIEQLQLVERAIQDTSQAIFQEQHVDWSRMLTLIHLTGMEKTLKNQYLDASHITSRINLHHLYAANPQGWFPWVYSHLGLEEGMQVLELGCGDGTLWAENRSLLPEHSQFVLSDISEGMLRDARRKIGSADPRFSYTCFDCHSIPFPEESFDVVIADHLLFYCQNLPQVCSQVRRVLKQGGRFLCTTYGAAHMQEVSRLAQGFDERIVLSANHLYEHFGKENGEAVLREWFSTVVWHSYEDSLLVTDAEPLISYILSCHGNQNQYLLDRYSDFRAYVKRHIGKGFSITKDAGLFYSV